MRNPIFETNSQKVLDFLIQDPGKQFLAKEIEKETKMSRAGVNFAVRSLSKAELIIREKKASIYLYSIDHYHPVIKQLKVLQIIIRLYSLVNQLKRHSKKIILFGSCSRGENRKDSDIDLCVLTDARQNVEETIKKSRSKSKIQPIIRNATQFYSMEQKESILFEEINRGITLWES